MKIGCVVLAAGNGSRFGENKLLHQFDGETMISRAFSAVPAEKLNTVVVVTQYHEIEDLAKENGFLSIHNEHPDWGQSYSVKLGLQGLIDCDAVLFQVSDQPFLTRQSVSALIDFYVQHPDHIVALCYQGQRGNPCLFPSAYFPELMAMEGDHGGNVVIRKHEGNLLLLEVPARELTDIDTPYQQDLF